MTAYQVCVILLVFPLILCAPFRSAPTCGYASCNPGKPGMINVHLVPHTHDDVGWLKTVDQYYYGARNEICHRGVQYILDSVVDALLENPARRFIYVEMAFFWRWWNEQTPEKQDLVKQLVNEGRLEFISGGWSMNDEATTHYNSIIDQHSLGAEFLRETFGECARPKIGWQIDPFGHSREMASLLAQMGFDGLLFGRIDYQDRIPRTLEKNFEMIWKGSANLGEDSWLFTSVLPHSYSEPFSFCFDILCDDQPIMDDPHLDGYNVFDRVEGFLRAAHVQSLIYSTNHLIMTMGDDFSGQNANENFKNLDKLISHVNRQQANGSDVNIFYSSPSCYLYALNQVEKSWTEKSDDFFPYASVPFVYWTGYFTSRPALKRYERVSNQILQVTRQLNGLSQLNQRSRIFNLSEAMGLAQHHDAVSGTEKQQVAEDYAQRLSVGIDLARNVIDDAYSRILGRESGQFLCLLTNISECSLIEGQPQFTLTVWNPIIHPVTIFPRVPVTGEYSILDSQGNLLSSEYLPIEESVKKIPGRQSRAMNEHIFEASLPPLGFNTYQFKLKSTSEQKRTIETTRNDLCVLENEHLRVEFDAQGVLRRVVNLDEDITVKFLEQGFYWYASHPGDSLTPEFPGSGAYIFRPLFPEALPVTLVRQITCRKTPTVEKATIIFTDWLSEEISLYRNGSEVEIQWIVGSIPIDDGIGKEIILRYSTEMASGARFFTDSNGRELLERVRNRRPTWDYVVDEPISGNYYPINSRIAIRDEEKQLTILTDRSEGGGSLYDGSIEVMIHRRILHDDSMGVGEALNETAFGQGLVVIGRHLLLLNRLSTAARAHRIKAQQFFMFPLTTYSLNPSSFTWSALGDVKMPENVHLLTLDQLKEKEYLLRVENYFELNEDPIYSQPVTIDLQVFFQTVGKIDQVLELILTANLPREDLQRLKWKSKDSTISIPSNSQPVTNTSTITLNPMQIRTFQITLA